MREKKICPEWIAFGSTFSILDDSGDRGYGEGKEDYMPKSGSFGEQGTISTGFWQPTRGYSPGPSTRKAALCG